MQGIIQHELYLIHVHCIASLMSKLIYFEEFERNTELEKWWEPWRSSQVVSVPVVRVFRSSVKIRVQ